MTVGDGNVYLVDEHVSKGRGSRDKTYTPSNEAPRHVRARDSTPKH